MEEKLREAMGKNDVRDGKSDVLVESESGQVSSAEANASQLPRLTGSQSLLEESIGAPGSLDRVDDVEQGDKNQFNSKEFRYASFFNRLRDAIAQHWEPQPILRARDPHGNVFGVKTRTTGLKIRLTPNGQVVDLRVMQSSGIDFLDDEAMRAVRAAAPFSNPPSGLVSKQSGYIEFDFGFVVYFDRKGRIYRY